MQPRADPRAEIRILSVGTVSGANYWATVPVTRADLAVGAFDEISSADVEGFTDRLLAAFPGLVEHRCSVGSRGGFVMRLRRGTYAPHILEHVALELQSEIGHEVGFGRARGTDTAGEYTVVVEHLHSEVGREAVVLALQYIRAAFGGKAIRTGEGLATLRRAAGRPDPLPRPQEHVACGVVGGGDRSAVRDAVLALRKGRFADIRDVAPAMLLDAGLPYRYSATAVILDAHPIDVPDYYREPDRAARLHSVVADGVPRGGFVVIPAGEPELRQRVEEAGVRSATFSLEPHVSTVGLNATVAGGRLSVRDGRTEIARAEIDPRWELRPQVAAVLAAHILERQEVESKRANPGGDEGTRGGGS